MTASAFLTFEPPNLPHAGRFPPRAASFERTLEDEILGCTYGVRLYYLWNDYDPADGAIGNWGARIVGLEVLNIECFEASATIPQHTAAIAAAAWNIVEQDRDLLEAEARRAGQHSGVGNADPLFGLQLAVAQPSSTSTLAASERQPSQTQRQRKWG